MADEEWLHRIRQHIEDSQALLDRMTAYQAKQDAETAFRARKSFELPEAFALLGKLEQGSLNYRLVAERMMPTATMTLDEAIGALVTLEGLVLDSKLDHHAQRYIATLRQKLAFPDLLDLGDVAKALATIRDSDVCKEGVDLLRAAVKRRSYKLRPSWPDLRKELRTPMLRSLVTDLVTRQALQGLNWSGTAAQVTTALQQHAALLGFPETVRASIAANDSRLRQWLKDRTVRRDDWVCLNPNPHGSGRSKLKSVFAFCDPNVAFEFRLTFT